MSTSPEKDLHSVYIDGEMPENFLSEYEKAVASDEKAALQLKKMQNLHQLFQEDAKAKTVDEVFAEESFKRLQSRMSYSRTIGLTKKSYVVPFVKYASSFAAAAAVFAVVFIPVHNRALNAASTKEVAAIEIKKEINPLSETQLVIDGNLHAENLTQGIAVASTAASRAPHQESRKTAESADGNLIQNGTEAFDAQTQDIPFIEQKTVRATSLASNGADMYGNRHSRNTIRGRRFRMPQVDPFRPDFSSSSMRISVPKFDEMSNNFEKE